MAGAVEVVSHWHHAVADFNTSALEFFKAIETVLIERQTPVRAERLDYREKRSALRQARISSRVVRAILLRRRSGELRKRLLLFVVAGAPHAGSSLMAGCGALLAVPIAFVIFVKMAGIVLGTLIFFVALGALVVFMAQSDSEVVENTILSLPVLGPLYLRYAKPVTYYSLDTRKMFEETVHRIITDHIAALLTVAKLPALEPDDLEIVANKPLI